MGIVVRVTVEGGRQMLAAFRDLPKEASNALRDANQEISEHLAAAIRRAAQGSSPQSALMVPGIKAKRDRIPYVEAGGKRRVGRNKVPMEKILFGANFGAHRLHQFRPVTKPDYWFFTTVEQQMPEVERRWIAAAESVLDQWGRKP